MECVEKFPTKVPEDFSWQYNSDHNFRFVADVYTVRVVVKGREMMMRRGGRMAAVSPWNVP